jgi:phosphomannomutase
MKRLIVFDLDGTLAPSKSAIDAATAALVQALLGVANVAIISGGDWPQFEKQVLSNLAPGDYLSGLSLLPTCGTKFFRYSGQWTRLYSEDFTAAEKAQIESAFRQAIQTAGLEVEKVWGETIEDRGSQITYSALGQLAPLEEKVKLGSRLRETTKDQRHTGQAPHRILSTAWRRNLDRRHQTWHR